MAGENVIPKAVQDVQAELDALEAEVEAQQTPAAPQPAPEDGKTPEEGAPAPVAPVEEAKPVETPAPEPEPEPTEALEDAPDELATLKQEHAALMRSAENDKRWFQSQISSRDKQIQALKAELAAKAEAAAPASIEINPDEAGLTSDERTYLDDPDLKRLAEKLVLAERKKNQPKPEPEPEVAPEAPAETPQEAFWRVFEGRVQDWRAVNGDPKFLTWLDGTDSYGRKRSDVLKRAQAPRWDGDEAADIFLAWKTESQKKPNGNLPSKTAQAMPRTQAAGPTAPAKKVYTMAEYDSEMTRLTRMQIESPGEAAKLKQELESAERDGRIRP